MFEIDSLFRNRKIPFISNFSLIPTRKPPFSIQIFYTSFAKNEG